MTAEENMSKDLYESLDNIYGYFRDKRTWNHEATIHSLEAITKDVIHTIDIRHSKERRK